MRSIVKFDKVTGTIESKIQVSLDSDLTLNIKEGEEYIEIPPNHPVLHEQSKWQVVESKLIRKPQTEIDAEEKRQKESEELRKKLGDKEQGEFPFAHLLAEINAERATLNKQPISLEQALSNVKKVMEGASLR